MLINVLPDGQEWKPFHSGLFRDNPESTTNSIYPWIAGKVFLWLRWSVEVGHQVQAGRYDYRDSSSKDLRLTPIYLSDQRACSTILVSLTAITFFV